ncbi:MAG: hypothetical protein DRP87_06560 [Spirochaetes bacterium]|nr:MAG: hypothetical protein DRP87_06560 [Spirochaetota bacterium]
MKNLQIKNSQFGLIVSLPGLILLLLWVGLPLMLLIFVSFTRYDVINPVKFVGLQNYIYLFKDRIFKLALTRTLIFFAGSTLVTFLFSVPAAWFLSRIRYGGTLIRTLIMFPWAVPLIVSGFIWGWIFNASYGVLNHILTTLGIIKENINILGKSYLAIIAVIIADSWTRIPFMTILTLAGFTSISKSLYEAASIDGADIFYTTWHITLKLSKGPILTGLLITSIFSFRTIDAIFSLTKGGPAKATYVLGMLDLDYIYSYLRFGLAGALSIIMLVLCMLIAGIYVFFLLKE